MKINYMPQSHNLVFKLIFSCKVSHNKGKIKPIWAADWKEISNLSQAWGCTLVL